MDEIVIARRLNARQVAIREQLLAAARDLGRDGDITAVTMTAVADRAGIGRATTYRYFSSRDAMLAEAAGIVEVRISPDRVTGQFCAQAWTSLSDVREGIEPDGTGVAVTIPDAYAEAIAQTLRSTTAAAA